MANSFYHRAGYIKKSVLVIFITIAAIFLYLVLSESGLSFILSNADKFIPGNLSTGNIQGCLAGPINLSDIRYENNECDIKIKSLYLDWRLLQLIKYRVNITCLNSSDILIDIKRVEKQAVNHPEKLPGITLPFSVVLENIHLSNIRINNNKNKDPSFVINELELDAVFDENIFKIKRLGMERSDVSLELYGEISPRGMYPLDLNAEWSIRPEKEYAEISGKGTLNGSLENLRITYQIERPFNLKLNAEIKGKIYAEGETTLFNMEGNWDNFKWPAKESKPVIVSKNGKFDIQGYFENREGYLNIFFKETHLFGTLNDYPFSVNSEFEIKDKSFYIPKFELKSGTALLSASGTWGETASGKWEISIPDVENLFPEGKGSIYGKGSIEGKLNTPSIIVELNGENLSYGKYRSGRITADMNVDISNKETSRVKITAEDLYDEKERIKIISLNAEGRASSHSVELFTDFREGSLEMAIDAQYNTTKFYKGVINRGKINIKEYGAWEMKGNSEFYVSPEKAKFEKLCFEYGSASVCLNSIWEKGKGFKGNAEVVTFPLSLFLEGIGVDGSMDGNAMVEYRNGEANGGVLLFSKSGNLFYKTDEEPVLVPFDSASLTGTLNKEGLNSGFSISLRERGDMKAKIFMPGFNPMDIHQDQPLSGNIDARFVMLDFIPVLTPYVKNTTGEVMAELILSGDIGAPDINGEIVLKGENAYIPSLNITLKNIYLDLNKTAQNAFKAEGSINSGKGFVNIKTEFVSVKPESIKGSISLTGNNLEIINLPDAKIIIDPDISMNVEKRNIVFAGSVTIPSAKIFPKSSSEVITVSDDAVIITHSADRKKKEKPWLITGKLKVTMGDNVQFAGFGLTCKIAGSIILEESPDNTRKAYGEIQIVEGIYKAYGQKLKIETGRLIFIGLADNPGLDIKAIKKINEVTAGVKVSGTLRNPQLNVFSIPAMDQSDALSYLLFSRPMKDISDSEGNQLYSAALLAGLGGGESLAYKIGKRFGIESVELEKTDNGGQVSLFLGKHLSPKLYISYGLGVLEPVNTFRLRYTISPKWSLLGEYGVVNSGDFLYTIEK